MSSHCKYYISLKADPESYVDVPANAHVEDWGVCIKIVQPCRCACGHPHNAELRVIDRGDILHASVVANGLSYPIVTEKAASR